MPQGAQTASEIHRIAQGFSIPSVTVDGTSFESIYRTVPPLIDGLRRGEGPALVEASVVRLDPHSSSDDQRKYRSAAELEALAARDPIVTTEQYVIDEGLLDRTQVESIRTEIRAEVDRAADEADAVPPPSTEDVLANIYAADDPVVRAGPTSMPRSVSEDPITSIDAINHRLREEMERNPKIVMWGETSVIRRVVSSVSPAA